MHMHSTFNTADRQQRTYNDNDEEAEVYCQTSRADAKVLAQVHSHGVLLGSRRASRLAIVLHKRKKNVLSILES